MSIINDNVFEKGTFFIGCNYWASHAGTNMWSDWNEKTVESDLKKLSENNVKLLRVFPLWSDFQPITKLLGGNAEFVAVSHNEKFLNADNEEEAAGVSAVMIDRFARFCRLAEKYNFKLLVALLNGWMSGRDFIPPALIGHNLYKDSFALKWEIKFVRYFVKRFKNEKSIVMWEAGNECNCMDKADSKETAWVWTSTITSTIKSEDPDRPISSGMHGMYSGAFDFESQRDNCDYLTVHPYMAFTPYCISDGIISPKAIMHASSELTYYSDLSGKPCFVEEIGTLCDMMGSEENVARFVRAGLFDAWASGGLSYIWWCAFDQTNLSHAPYEWCDVERELGMFRSDGSAKPLVEEINKFAEILGKLPFSELPEKKREAVCLVNPTDLKAVFGCYHLSKRAGFDIKFADIGKPVKKSKAYIIPGNANFGFLKKSVYDSLVKNVEEGACLFISLNNSAIGGFEKLVGCKSDGRLNSGCKEITYNGVEFKTYCPTFLKLKPTTAEVLAKDADGNPVFVKNKLGKGYVFFFNGAIEYGVSDENMILSSKNDIGECLYKTLATAAKITSNFNRKTPTLTVNEYELDKNSTLVIAINYTDETVKETIDLNGQILDKVFYGNCLDSGGLIDICVNGADAAVFVIKRKM